MENRVNYDYKQKITNKERNADKNLALSVRQLPHLPRYF